MRTDRKRSWTTMDKVHLEVNSTLSLVDISSKTIQQEELRNILCIKLTCKNWSYPNCNTKMPMPNWTCGAMPRYRAVRPIRKRDTNVASLSNVAHAVHARKPAMVRLASLSTIPMRSDEVVSWVPIVGVQTTLMISEAISCQTLSSKWTWLNVTVLRILWVTLANKSGDEINCKMKPDSMDSNHGLDLTNSRQFSVILV